MVILLLADVAAWTARQLPDQSAWLPAIVAATLHVALLGGFLGLPAGLYIWAERKLSARIQDRLGPTRVGGRFGWLQSLADGVKLIQKEDLRPAASDGVLFLIAPYIVVVSAFAAFLFLPFSRDWVAVSLECGLFFALAVHSLEVLGVIVAGYASGSKWALFGGMRQAAQLVSYEIPLGLCAIIPVMAVGTMDLNVIAEAQSAGMHHWLLLRNPFLFAAFVVLFIVSLAATKRAPFDLAEAESELVAGFLTEYSGMRWSFFFLAEYASMFFVSGLAVMLFLGGWWTGLPFVDEPVADLADGYAGRVLGLAVFLTKTTLLVMTQIWVRWTLPRLRIDQVMTTGLKYLLPISCGLLFGAAIWPLLLASLLGRPTVFGG